MAAERESLSNSNVSHDVHNVCWPKIYSTRQYDRFMSYKDNGTPVTVRRSSAPMLTKLWRKLIKREKKRMSRYSNSTRFAYDEHSYSQNFDQGLGWAADPDDILCSFSARFATPSKILRQACIDGDGVLVDLFAYKHDVVL